MSHLCSLSFVDDVTIDRWWRHNDETIVTRSREEWYLTRYISIFTAGRVRNSCYVNTRRVKQFCLVYLIQCTRAEQTRMTPGGSGFSSSSLYDCTQGILCPHDIITWKSFSLFLTCEGNPLVTGELVSNAEFIFFFVNLKHMLNKQSRVVGNSKRHAARMTSL